ncbi:MAG: response regulator [Deltaproteobacteria bacterium]|nr:response regulator [Deltaproteobacteria bacterium]
MQLGNIILQSAGSLAMAVLALLMLIVQAAFFLRKPRFSWYAWGAAISFSAMLYAIGIFFEYNAPPGPLNRSAGLLEYTAIICLIQCMYGFTFSYLGIKSKRYHPIAGICHALILLLLWSTDYIVADRFVTRDFIGLETPYIEPALGPLGPVFVLYAVLASIMAIALWVRRKGSNPRYRKAYLAGMGFWIVLGAHDGLASLGVPSLQYFMEYGFMGFSMAVLWVVFDDFLEATAEDKYRVITESANDCILVIQDGKMVFGNPACMNVLGQSLNNAAARDFVDIVVPEDRKQVLENCRRLLSGGNALDPYTVRVVKGNGEEGFVEINASMITYRKRPAVLAIMRDMTERRREEATRLENEKKIARLKKTESLGLLAGGVAHDLNNVLFGVVGYPGIILSKLPQDSQLIGPIKAIETSGKMAAAIVQDLLSVTRGVAMPQETMSLNDVINEYLESPEHSKLLEFHPSITVDTHLDVDLFNIRGSQSHVRSVVMNLVSNASEAIEESGHVTLSTSNRYVDKPVGNYDTIESGEYVVLEVSDDGTGIPPGDLEQIFEPFFTKKVMGRSGTGLGLALVWNVIHDHDGYIDVQSDDSGTTFTLYFPITREELPDNGLSLPIKDLSGDGESILVVDDVKSQREILCSMLKDFHYRPKAVSSGEEAIEYLKENSADLVLLDMIMDPGMNGRQTYEKIIALHPGQNAVIISGYTQTEDVKETQRMGAGPYLKKPVTLEKFGLTVKEALIRARSGQAENGPA